MLIFIDIMNNICVETDYDPTNLHNTVKGLYMYLSEHIEFGVKYDLQIRMMFNDGNNNNINYLVDIKNDNDLQHFLTNGSDSTFQTLETNKYKYTDIRVFLYKNETDD
jgi:hypothetical protein